MLWILGETVGRMGFGQSNGRQQLQILLGRVESYERRRFGSQGDTAWVLERRGAVMGSPEWSLLENAVTGPEAIRRPGNESSKEIGSDGEPETVIAGGRKARTRGCCRWRSQSQTLDTVFSRCSLTTDRFYCNAGVAHLAQSAHKSFGAGCGRKPRISGGGTPRDEARPEKLRGSRLIAQTEFVPDRFGSRPLARSHKHARELRGSCEVPVRESWFKNKNAV